MNITVLEQDGTAVFRVAGKVVGHHIVDLCKRLEAVRGGGIARVVVDLSDVDEIDSCGLGGLLYSRRILEKNGLHLLLARLRPEVRTLFRDCNFDNAIQVVDSY